MKHYRFEEVGDGTLGGGHSESDAFLIVHDRVALMADLLGIRMHPWMGDGHPERWIEILEEVERLGATTYVPGHGPVGSLEDVRVLREHLRSFLDSPEEIEQRYPDWDFQGEMVDRNRTFLRERAT